MKEKKKTPAQAANKVGDTWTRDSYEVHHKSEDGKWYVMARSAATIEEAREQIKQRAEWDRNLLSFVNLGKPIGYHGLRIVHVVANCEVVEVK